MKIKRNKPVSQDTHDNVLSQLHEARENAAEWARYSEKLERDLAWAMDANACLALELAEKDWQLSTLRGEC